MEPTLFGIYGPKYSGKTTLINKLKERGVPENLLTEYDHETIPQPGHGAIIIMCTRSAKHWVEYMNTAAEIYPINSILPILACADKETIDERLESAPLGALAVDLRPKDPHKSLTKLVEWLSSAYPVSAINRHIDGAYAAEKGREKSEERRDLARRKRKLKKTRKSEPDDEGWFQV